jgi:formylglycine-generating enzyme required for sulfatase activity
MHVYARLTIKGNENVIDDTTSITVYLQNSGLGMKKWLSIPVHVSLLSNYPEKTFLQDIGGYRFAMLPVKGGTFTMGIRSEESGLKAQDTTAVDDDATHFVHLSDYFVAETEVTKILWHRIMPVDYDIMFDESSDPVNGVTWQHCKDFIAELNKQTGYKYRLLTEAEWEYAARGGADSKNYMYAGSNYLDEVAWFYENSAVQQYGGPRRNVHNVAEKKPNELGIYDMSGNVSEWCSDRYSAETYLNDHAKGVVTNPKGATDGSLRVIRGGSYLDGRDVFYLSKRNYGEEQGSSPRVGFRLAMSYDDYIEMLKTKKKIYAETHDLK